MLLGIVFTLLAMVLVGRGVQARARRGEPMARYAIWWAVILLALFATAMLVDRHAATTASFT